MGITEFHLLLGERVELFPGLDKTQRKSKAFLLKKSGWNQKFIPLRIRFRETVRHISIQMLGCYHLEFDKWNFMKNLSGFFYTNLWGYTYPQPHLLLSIKVNFLFNFKHWLGWNRWSSECKFVIIHLSTMSKCNLHFQWKCLNGVP